jgi:hypothetical protein
MQKKPAIYLLVILPILGIGGILVIIELETAYASIVGIPLSAIPNLNGFLIFIPAFFLWIPVALLVSNMVLFVLPPLRRVAEKYASEGKRPGFLESQKELGKVMFIMAIICIPLIVLGFLL